MKYAIAIATVVVISCVYYFYNYVDGFKIISRINAENSVISLVWSPDARELFVSNIANVESFSSDGKFIHKFGDFLLPNYDGSIGFVNDSKYLVTAFSKKGSSSGDNKEERGIFTVWNIDNGDLIDNIYSGKLKYKEKVKKSEKYVISNDEKK